MDFDRYKRLEYFIQNWQIGKNKRNILDYLCYLGLVERIGNKYQCVTSDEYLFKCDDGNDRIVFVEYEGEYFLLLEFWIKLIIVNKNRGLNIQDKIKYKKFN